MEDNIELTKKDKTWGVLCHLLTFTGLMGIPFGNILAPLVIWLIKKAESEFVDYNSREALNFQISITIYAIVTGALCFVFIGFLLIPVILIADIVLTIMATVKANNGDLYKYPLTLKLIK